MLRATLRNRQNPHGVEVCKALDSECVRMSFCPLINLHFFSVYDCRLHCTPTWSETGANGVIREVGCQLVLSKICEPADPSRFIFG